MKLEFESIRDLLSFIKLALYMTEKKAAQKMLKWKKHGELQINTDESQYTVTLSETLETDKEFNKLLEKKYDTWVLSNKQTTL